MVGHSGKTVVDRLFYDNFLLSWKKKYYPKSEGSQFIISNLHIKVHEKLNSYINAKIVEIDQLVKPSIPYSYISSLVPPS